MILDQIRAALAEQITAVTGVQCHTHPPDAADPVAPLIIVGRAAVLPHVTFGAAGLDQADLDVWAVCPRMDAATATRTLDDLTNSVRVAVEADRTLGGTCTTLRVAGKVTPGEVGFASGVDLPAVEMTVEIWGSKP